MNIIGQCGPLLGTRLYPDTDKPYYVKGLSVSAGFMLLVAVLAVLLKGALRRANQKLRSERFGDFEMEHDGRSSKNRAEQRFEYIL